MTHTQGPWHVESDGTSISNATQVFITAPAPDGASREEEKANAALIAAAPDILEVLDRCLRYLSDLNGCEWIKGDGAGEVDMRQRAKALQQLAFDVSQKAKGETK